MPPIPISQLIQILEPWKYKLHAARYSSGGGQPLDVFVSSREAWLGWNRWRSAKNEFSRDYVFSLIDFYRERDIWLFGGVFRVTGRRPVEGADGYEIEEVTEFSNLVGRLKICMPKPSRGRAFYLEHHYQNMEVDEILRTTYSGMAFPGFEGINIAFHELKAIIASEKADWKAALMSIKGVYCIHDRTTGMKYVGSAYGETGIWSRWAQYACSGHGNNVFLMKAVEDLGANHVMQNWQISLLEHRSTKVDDEVIIKREGWWKQVMLSRGEFGYNGN